MKPLNGIHTKILVIENALVIAKTLEDQLEDMGFQTVETIALAEDPVKHALELQPDIALIDLDGDHGREEPLRAAAELREKASVPSVFLTRDLTEELFKTLEPLAFGVLSKPVGERDLRIGLDLALRRARAERELNERNAQSEAIAELSLLAVSRASLEEVQDKAVALVARTLGVPFSRIMVLSLDGTQLRLRHGVGWEPGSLGTVTVNTGRGSAVGYTLEAGHPVMAVDLRHETRFFVPPLLRDHGIISSLSVAIKGAGDEYYGVLAAESPRPRHFSEHDIHFLQSVAGLISQCLLRDEARLALEQQASQIRDLYENAPCGYHSVDADGTITQMNRTELAWLGYQADEILGVRSFRDLLSASSRSAYESSIEESRRRGSVQDVEVELVRKDGSRLPALLHSAWVRDNGFQPDSCRSIVIDLTERQKLAEARRLRDESERFTRIASHDLREPLRGIHLYAQLLERQLGPQLESEPRRYLEYIIGNARRMYDLVHRLTEYALKGNGMPQPSLVEAGEVLAEALRAIQPLVEQSGAEIHVAELPTLRADRAQLGLVFQNLLSNAFRFCREGSPRVTVAARRGEGEGFVFSVSDNGCGFKTEQAEQLFEIFPRVSSSGEDTAPGVGLAICKRIIENHGGRMWVESEPGRGSTFFFYLPEHPPIGRGGSAEEIKRHAS